MNLCFYQGLCSNLHGLVFPAPQHIDSDPHSPLIQVLLEIGSKLYHMRSLSERYGKPND